MSSTSNSAHIELKACPDKPNCVSSMASGHHAIEPFRLTENPNLDAQKLIQLINNAYTNVSITNNEQHIHIEFTSHIFRFIDDVDLIIDLKQNIIHVRSASRTGHYDFGVNRRRVEKLRILFKDAGLIL